MECRIIRNLTVGVRENSICGVARSELAPVLSVESTKDTRLKCSKQLKEICYLVLIKNNKRNVVQVFAASIVPGTVLERCLWMNAM